MNKQTFLEEVEKYKPIAIGNYRAIAKLAGMDHHIFTYAMAGRAKDEVYPVCFQAIKDYCNKVIENIISEDTINKVKVA